MFTDRMPLSCTFQCFLSQRDCARRKKTKEISKKHFTGLIPEKPLVQYVQHSVPTKQRDFDRQPILPPPHFRPTPGQDSLLLFGFMTSARVKICTSVTFSSSLSCLFLLVPISTCPPDNKSEPIVLYRGHHLRTMSEQFVKESTRRVTLASTRREDA